MVISIKGEHVFNRNIGIGVQILRDATRNTFTVIATDSYGECCDYVAGIRTLGQARRVQAEAARLSRAQVVAIQKARRLTAGERMVHAVESGALEKALRR